MPPPYASTVYHQKSTINIYYLLQYLLQQKMYRIHIYNATPGKEQINVGMSQSRAAEPETHRRDDPHLQPILYHRKQLQQQTAPTHILH
jgi:hypothetical protein